MRCTRRACSVADGRLILETERLVLRREQPGDYDVWLTRFNTPEVTAHLGGPRTPEQIAEKFAHIARDWDAHGYSFMMVTLKESGLLIGTSGIGPIQADALPQALRDGVQIGWTIAADHWGRGYASEAARGVMAYAFGQAGVAALYGQTSLSNNASWRLMEKLGMTRRADIDYVDPAYPPEDNPTIIYALTAGDWRAQAQERLQ